MSAHPLPAEVRAARSYLRQRGIRTEDISPKTFAGSAKETSLGFKGVMKFLGNQMAGGQNQTADIHSRVMDEAGDKTASELPTGGP